MHLEVKINQTSIRTTEWVYWFWLYFGCHFGVKKLHKWMPKFDEKMDAIWGSDWTTRRNARSGWNASHRPETSMCSTCSLKVGCVVVLASGKLGWSSVIGVYGFNWLVLLSSVFLTSNVFGYICSLNCVCGFTFLMKLRSWGWLFRERGSSSDLTDFLRSKLRRTPCSWASQAPFGKHMWIKHRLNFDQNLDVNFAVIVCRCWIDVWRCVGLNADHVVIHLAKQRFCENECFV